ncbi:MAG: small multi-drug export protein [Bacillota bacterium]
MDLFDRVLAVVTTAATPVAELRGAIPLGLALGFSPWEAWAWAVLGNLIPVPFLLWGSRAGLIWLERQPWLHSRLKVWGERSSSRLAARVRRWGLLGLVVFVAIPLPGTGAWTGAMAATFLGIRPWPALLAITLGVTTAGTLLAAAAAAAMTIGR